MAPDELDIIERYFRPLAGEGSFDLRDDAARLDVPPDCDLVVTADMLAMGVHVLPDDPPETIARKALRVNLSDLAAKGARPLAYTLSIGLAPGYGDDWLAAFAAGLRADQELFGVRLIGGDTISTPAGLVVSITAFGCAPKGRMVHRFGGSVGDRLYVSGEIGAAAAGLALLRGESGFWDFADPVQRQRLVERYRVPEPRVALASALVAHASAAMDVSDGLIGDCDKLASACGCAAAIDADAVPLPPALRDAPAQLVAWLISAGDDYEVLAAVPPESEAAFRAAAHAAAVPMSRIGVLCAGSGPTEVLWRGEALRVGRRSYVHGRGEDGR